MGGNIVEADKRHARRRMGAFGDRSGARSCATYVKWDDQPTSLQHFAESAVRAYKIAMTPPMGPVHAVARRRAAGKSDSRSRRACVSPSSARVVPPQGDSGALAEAAKLLVAAENPVIICDRHARTPAGMARLVELAETLQCAVIDNAGRMNFPSRHPLNQSFRRGTVIPQADVILALEMNDIWGALNAFSDRIVRTSRRSPRKARRSSRWAAAISI